MKLWKVKVQIGHRQTRRNALLRRIGVCQQNCLEIATINQPINVICIMSVAVVCICWQVSSAMKALSGSMRKLIIATGRRGDQRPITIHFSLRQSCLFGWTLDSFQLVVQGIEQFQFVVGDLLMEPQSVGSPVAFIRRARFVDSLIITLDGLSWWLSDYNPQIAGLTSSICSIVGKNIEEW